MHSLRVTHAARDILLLFWALLPAEYTIRRVGHSGARDLSPLLWTPMPWEDIIGSDGHSQRSTLLACDPIASLEPRRTNLSDIVRVTAILS